MTIVNLPDIRVIPFKKYPAAYNMAADEYLLSLDQPILRFYGWKNHTLSFGRSNFHPKGINQEILDDVSIDKVKRLSGGKTVFHQYELTYTFCCNSELFPASILESYRLISQPLADAFVQLGLNPEMEKTGKIKSDTTICFKEVSSYEITLKQKKIIGSAQYRRKKRFFQHGSIVIDIDWDFWHLTWNLPLDSQILKKRITSIYEASGEKPGPDALMENISDKFQKRFEVTATIEEFSDQEYQGIGTLMNKYRWKGFE